MAHTPHKNSVNLGDGNTKSGNISHSFNTQLIVNATEKPELLGWLSPLDPLYRHREVRADRQKGVGNWLLETNEFQKWRGKDNGVGKAVCFCYGEPGVGKTYLSSIVIDSLCDQAEQGDIVVAGLYFDFQEQHEQKTIHIMGAILKQLMVKDGKILGPVREAFRGAKNKFGSRGLRLEDLMEMLRITIASLPQVFICIDALDECASKYLPELLGSLRDIVRELPSVRVFLTGRFPVKDTIERHFTAPVMIEISPKSHDLRIYLEKKLELDTVSRAMDKELQASILGLSQSKTSKSFLLISLSIDAILREVTIFDRKKKLGETANGGLLKDAYTKTLGRIKAQEGDRPRIGLEALKWVAYSKRPLQESELCHALGVKIGSTDSDPERVFAIETLLEFSLGLITLNEASSTFRLIHSTLRDHLTDALNLFQSSHSMIAEICLTYLNFQSVRRLPLYLPSAMSTAPLLGYASCYWERHAREGMTENAESLALTLLNDGFGQHISSGILLSYEDYPIELRVLSLDPEQDRFGGFTGLHWAASLGMLKMSIALLKRGERRLNATDITGKTATAWAAGGGHTKILEILLKEENINPNIADNNGLTPLSFAAKYAREGVAEALIEWEGINPDPVHKDGTTPLLLVATNWNVKILKMLLKRDVNPNAAKIGDGRTPLSWAAWRGDKEVVKIILERRDINLDPIHPDGRTPLLWAVSKGHEDVVKLLLERKDATFGLTASQILIDCLVISVSLGLLAFLSWIIPSSPISLSPRR